MIEQYSYSMLSMFEKCPRSFFYRYVLNIDRTNEILEYGKMIHEDIKNFLVQGTISAQLNPYITPNFLDLTQKISKEFVEREWFTEVNGRVFKGIVDALIIDPPIIIDWKTNRNKTASKLQLHIYAWVLEKNEIFKVSNIKGVLYYLRLNTQEVFDITEEDKKYAQQYIINTINHIEKKIEKYQKTRIENVFEKIEKNCRWCLYADLCQSNNFNLKEQEILDIFKTT